VILESIRLPVPTSKAPIGSGSDPLAGSVVVGSSSVRYAADADPSTGTPPTSWPLSSSAPRADTRPPAHIDTDRCPPAVCHRTAGRASSQASSIEMGVDRVR